MPRNQDFNRTRSVGRLPLWLALFCILVMPVTRLIPSLASDGRNLAHPQALASALLQPVISVDFAVVFADGSGNGSATSVALSRSPKPAASVTRLPDSTLIARDERILRDALPTTIEAGAAVRSLNETVDAASFSARSALDHDPTGVVWLSGPPRAPIQIGRESTFDRSMALAVTTTPSSTPVSAKGLTVASASSSSGSASQFGADLPSAPWSVEHQAGSTPDTVLELRGILRGPTPPPPRIS